MIAHIRNSKLHSVRASTQIVDVDLQNFSETIDLGVVGARCVIYKQAGVFSGVDIVDADWI